MKRLLTLTLGFGLTLTARAELELVPDETPAAVFASQLTTIHVVFRNPGEETVETELSTRLYQVASSVRVPVGDAQPWKKLKLLPRQTVIESFPVTLPEVRTAHRFQVEWTKLGRTEITAYPPDLLKRLNALAGDNPVAVFDPDDKLRSLLKKTGVEFVDLEVETAEVRLAIVWSDKRLPESIESRVKQGLAVVWIRPQTLPTYVVRLEAGVVVLVPSSTLTGLTTSPQSQITLLSFAELALQPEAWRLSINNQP